MPSFFDLHVHTFKGSGDSSLSPEELAQEATRMGLTGVTLTEHSGWQDLHQFRAFAGRHDLLLIHAREFETEYGHVLAYGLDGYPPGASDVRTLRRAADRAGAYLVVAHPFRKLLNRPPHNQNLLYPDPDSHPRTPEEAVSHPLFELVDDLEVLNGATSERENLFALEVARRRGSRGTGGSDAHSTHGLGRAVTRFEEEVRSEAELLEALRAGAYTPVAGFNKGQMRPFDFAQDRPFDFAQGRPFGSAQDGSSGPGPGHGDAASDPSIDAPGNGP